MLDLVAERFKALGDRARLSLVQALRSGPLTVNELAAATEMGQANVSRHLASSADGKPAPACTPHRRRARCRNYRGVPARALQPNSFTEPSTRSSGQKFV